MHTDAALRRLPAPAAQRLVPYGQCLYLRHSPTGTKTWIRRSKAGGRWQVQRLGTWPAMSVATARAACEALGRNPGAAVERLLLADALDQFERDYVLRRYRTKRAAEDTMSRLRRSYAALLRRPVATLSRGDLLPAVERLHATAPNSATKLLAVTRQCTGWLAVRGLVPADPLAGVTAGRLGLEQYRPRERVLSDDELRALWLRDDADAHVLKFALLTASRIGEVLAWRPEQVAAKVWTIPLTKNGKPHTVPLSAPAAALLPLPSGIVYVSMLQRLKRTGATWTPHDLRRTAATLMRAAGVSIEVVEACLNHAPRRLIATYQRFDPVDEKRAALQLLARKVAEVVRKAKKV